MRLIDAELLIDCINTVQEMALAIGGKLEAIEPVNEGFISLINSQPTVDAIPVSWLTAQAENPSNSDSLRNAIDHIVYTMWAERKEE